VIYGTAHDDSLGDQIRVTVVATGLHAQGARRTAPPLQVYTTTQRTGTDNVGFQVPSNSVLGASPTSLSPSGQHDYGSSHIPSVWRRPTDRTQAAAKVDALSSGGMDDFEIPAFLRKQAD
jgi:cell division protein FtsZ